MSLAKTQADEDLAVDIGNKVGLTNEETLFAMDDIAGVGETWGATTKALGLDGAGLIAVLDPAFNDTIHMYDEKANHFTAESDLRNVADLGWIWSV